MGNRREAETDITAPSLACFTRRSLLPSCTQTARISLTRYDTLNRLSTVTDVNGSTVYGYDNVRNLQSVTYLNSVAHSYSYDTRNRLTSLALALSCTDVPKIAVEIDG